MSAYRRILVTGAKGFLGSHIVPALQQSSDSDIIEVTRADYDLLDTQQVGRMLKEATPDAVIHLAAKVGGIIANAKYPANFFYENTAINTAVFHACYQAGVKKLLTFIGGCSYPARAASPIVEKAMWDGYPQPESAAYSVAKKIMLVQSEAYRQQHGFNSVGLIPGNVDGEHYIFNLEQAHVIPSLIRKFIEAKENSAPFVTCFGSGKPTRDFVYGRDVAEVIPWFLENYDSSEPVNISSGIKTSIRELAESIKSITGYEGDIVWDTSKPDGQMDKIFSVEKLRSLGLSCNTALEEGLRKTVKWFADARVQGNVRL